MPELFPYQEEGIAWLEQRPRAFLADDPGLGKTAQAIRAAVGRTLVVAPAMLQGTWQDELETWADDPSRFEIVSYHKFCERDGAKLRPEPAYRFGKPRWETLIYDESHYLKGRKTTWTLASYKMRTDRTWFLTGTPIPNWAHELFTTLKLLHQDDPNQIPWRSYWRWVGAWFKTWDQNFGERSTTQIGDLKGLFANSSEKSRQKAWVNFYRGNDLDHLMLRRTRDEVLPDLPPLTESFVHLEMGAAQKKLYNDLKKQYLAWVEETGVEVAAFSSGGLHTKLAKVQTGIVSVDPSATKMESNKLTALRELLEAREGTPTLVICYYQNTARAIGRLLDEMKLKWDDIIGGGSGREEAKRDFQAGKLNVLVGTIETISEGLTLTRADCCVMVERSWKPYKNDQVIRRIHRIGQTRPVSIIYLITENALDSRITKVLDDKTGQQRLALNAGQFLDLL